jgi:hypothetical protein
MASDSFYHVPEKTYQNSEGLFDQTITIRQQQNMRSHFMLNRGAAVACAVTGATTLVTGIASAQFTALDTPSDAAYSDGWQMGDNGGFGFGPWGNNGTYNSAIQHNMSSSTHNNLGTPVWTLFNPVAPDIGNNNPPNVPSGGDISRAGRGILGGLQVSQTISTIIDNPTERRFFRGYTIRLVSGGQNTTYGGPAVSRLAVGTFEYFTYGRWYAGLGGTTLFDTDTQAGMQIDVTLTGANSYYLKMTPLANPSNFYSEFGTLAGSGTIDWIQFELYNTDSDHNPSPGSGTLAGTDFYVGSMSVVPEPSSLALLGLGSGLLFMRRRK